MVTDRRRSGAQWRSELPRRVAAAAHAGIDLVQVRERDLDGGELFDLVRDCVTAVAGTASRVVVNDRVDVALAAGAHGVHLRGDSFAASRVREAAGRRLLVGRSVHDVDEAATVANDRSVDYLLFGTIFATSSKAGRAPAGLTGLRAAAAAVTLPVLAIGGVSLQTVAGIAAADAAGLAAIGLFADCDLPELPPLVARARFLFDSHGEGSLT